MILSKNPQNRVTASLVILTDSSPYRQNEELVHASFTSIDQDKDRPSAISATKQISKEIDRKVF